MTPLGVEGGAQLINMEVWLNVDTVRLTGGLEGATRGEKEKSN